MTPVYSSETSHNGILGYTDKAADYIINDKCPFMLIFGDHTKAMNIASKSFSVMDNVKVLKPKNFSKLAAAFITTVWKSGIPNLGYSRHWSAAQKCKISLPATPAGEPDFAFMNLYMQNIFKKSEAALENLLRADKSKKSVDVVSWREFKIEEIFKTERIGKDIQTPTGAMMKRQDLEEGNIPRVTVSNVNNGITGYYAFSENKNYRVYDNFISVSFLGTVFYQAEQTSLDMKVHCLKPCNIELNIFIAEFLVTVIRKAIANFTYSEQLSSTVLPNIVIKLPATPDGEPDYAFMDAYMSEILNNAEAQIDTLLDLKLSDKSS